MNTNASAPRSDRPVACGILAAGRGQRFGPGKLTADLGGKPLWRWAIDSAIEAGVTNVNVVTNEPDIAAACAANGWAVITNPDAATGIASSIRLVAEIAPPDGNVIIALADMPFVEPAHFRRLAATEGAAFTRYPGGRPGVPASFTYAASRRLLALDGDHGAASLDWPGAAMLDPPSAETLLDIDTPKALERARAIEIRLSQAAGR